MTTNYIIVDDEHIAHDIVKGYCDAMPNLNLVKHCYDAIEAMECLRNHKVDLIFLDLNMPKLQGFSFLKTLVNPPKVIVTSAYQEFALEGYELNVVDYLLKPFSFERFVTAINKLEHMDKPKTNSTVKLEEERLFLRSNKKHVQVRLNDILYIESIGNYINMILADKEIQVREKISEIKKMLPNNKFMQVHKSFIVAKNHINSIEGNRIFIKDYVVPIGKTYKQNVNALLG
ncbi:LytR/AlgR family response regulator transcription factor [Croceivirga thetidis]|uniref:Response regulator transcription factor n=1 Tax=Croceivirga thetidis TaxID=2721623 RepID=A0ABX1GRT5_9FLAO|nr:LytTR family DNA-binding domain-containing protein [Croceivirga thetidis]NKI32343.1 response regulator transcription factor [Croceivirga thetidis]